MQNVIDSIALVICTRNRPNFISGLLENLGSLTTVPGKILIVDSSEDDLTLQLVKSSRLNVAKKVLYIKSAPGLPHQRNEGVRTILSSNDFNQVRIVSFTDDDCRLSTDYFEHLSNLLEANLHFSAVTGILVPSRRLEPSLLRRIFLLESRSSGSVLKSGCTTPIQCTHGLCEVEWMPGGSMNIKRAALESTQFDSQLRMYGEDLKMSLMLKKYGPLLAHAKMEYKHLEATAGKDNLVDVISFTDGIRWQLARDFSDQIKRKYVLWSIFGSIIANSIRYFKPSENSKDGKAILRGHLVFLLRLVGKKQYIQTNQ
jgi:GT2 family glycosyltransferase